MFGMGKEKQAELRYLAADYVTLKQGSFVVCAVTGQKIHLDNLNYWNVERQEAYVNGAASLKRELEVNA
ncbi:MAG: DUF2093 domain-containing protein [Rhizobiales bacterium]|nr:DUF2093 domain-containing protein [Hyphomicrobiales bacterium]NRB14402.1 DUF2093 domain-containing protein [Hyphomicrobiales bacterium]